MKINKSKLLGLLGAIISLAVAGAFLFSVASAWLHAKGPFVFGDEVEYAEMARAILAGDFLITGKNQYGPLFPYMLAAVSRVLSVEIHSAGKIINGVAWLASVCATYHIVRLLGARRSTCWFAGLLTLVAPFWTFALVTWADPVFYALFFVSCLCLALVLKSRCFLFRLLLAVVLGLLFLAKPIGIFYAVCLFCVLVLLYLRSRDRRHLVALAQIFVVWLACIVPWMARNLIESGGLLGYGYAEAYLEKMLQAQGLQAVILLFAGLAYQLSYIVLLSFGFIGVFVLLWIRNFKHTSEELNGVSAYLLLSLGLVALISDLHMTPNPFLGYWIANGRYYANFAPLVIALVFLLWQEMAARSKSLPAGWLLAVLAAQWALVILASPMEMAVPYSIVNNPDMGLMFLPNYFELHSFLVWKTRTVPNVFQIGMAVVLTAMPLLMWGWQGASGGAVGKASRKCDQEMGVLWLALLCVLMGSTVEYLVFTQMQGVQTEYNKLYIDHRAEMCGVVYADKGLDAANLAFNHQYWCSSGNVLPLPADTAGANLGDFLLLAPVNAAVPQSCRKIAEGTYVLFRCGGAGAAY